MSEKSQSTEFIVLHNDSLTELIDEITPAIYGNLKVAIELGKWPDGQKLKVEQLQNCMQAVILYEAKYVPEHERTGFDLPAACSSKISQR